MSMAWTALALAQSTGRLNVVKALKRAGEPKARNENNTAAFPESPIPLNLRNIA